MDEPDNQGLSKPDDSEILALLERAKKDIGALEELLAQFHVDVKITVASILKERYPTHGEDVVWMVYDKALRAFPKFRGEKKSVGEFRAWLKRIAMNTASTELREIIRYEERLVHADSAEDQRAIEELYGFATGTTPTGDMARKELCRVLEKALKQIPERRAKVIRLHYFEGKTFQEIADGMNCTLVAIHVLHCLARQGLRCVLGSRSSFRRKYGY